MSKTGLEVLSKRKKLTTLVRTQNMKTSSLKTVGQKSPYSMLICQFFLCVNLQTIKAK
jgi:hypothetical protein